jgi:[ribosomal protein S5]-alanine N-acetyltransferase
MQITTKRLVLRPFTADDRPAVLHYQRDPRYLRFYHWDDRTPDAVQAFVQRFLDAQAEEPRRIFQLAITLRGDNRLIGNCGVRMETAGAREAELGYELDPDYWGNGYATEAARAMLRWGFAELGLHRIAAQCIAENMASARVLQKLGLQLEGRLRENVWMKGRWWDTLVFAILDREWRERDG